MNDDNLPFDVTNQDLDMEDLAYPERPPEEFQRYKPMHNLVIARKIPAELQEMTNEDASVEMLEVCDDIAAYLPERWSAVVVYSQHHEQSLIRVRGPNCKNIKDRIRFYLFPNDYIAIDPHRKHAMRYAGNRLFEFTHEVEGGD